VRVPLDTAASICGVQPVTIRRWVFDGRIIRHDDGYDVDELLHWIDARNPDALMVRAGLAGEHGARLARRI
jgi:hypothetical protein